MQPDTVVVPASSPLIEGDFLEPVLVNANAAFARHSDRLVRHLFDVGLRLHTLRHRADVSGGSALGDGADEVAEVLSDLDVIIRDAGLAMLALACDSLGDDNGYGGSSSQSKRVFPRASR